MKILSVSLYDTDMAIKTDDGVEFLYEVVDKTGVACATVSDGHVIVFQRQKLLQLLQQTEGKDKVVIFVKRPGMNG